MKRIAVVAVIALFLLCFSGCAEGPKQVVKKYVESAQAGNVEAAKDYYVGGLTESCTTFKRRG